MYLHRLTMSNIGPFVGETIVDFAALSSTGLFLLEGPTGSGKSTVLDAIVFALYGSVATTTAGIERMRSDKAGPGDISVVELTFETTSGVYRVQRNPPYERLKKAGTGTTSEKAAVRLWRLSDPLTEDGELMSSRSHEADLEIQRILGLTKAQFVQTVLLPQGEFAAFLRATPTERQALLQRLFGTELYDSMTTEFEQRRKAAIKQRSEARRTLDHRITAFITAAECDDSEADGLRGAIAADLPTMMSSVIARHTDELAQATKVHAEAEAATSSTRQKLDVVNTEIALHTRLTDLRNRHAFLLKQVPSYRDKRIALDRLRAAQAIVPHRAGLHTAQQRVDELADAIAQRELSAAELGLTDWLENPGAGARSLQGVATSVAPAARDERELPSLKADLTKQQAVLDDLEIQRASLVGEHEGLPQRIADASAAAKEATVLAATADLANREVALARARLAAAAQVVTVQSEAATLRDELQELKRHAEAVDATRSRLARARLDGIAGELAATLRDGDACAVCGSTSHPKPASMPDEHPTHHDVEGADEEFAQAVARFEEVAAKVATIDSQLAGLVATSEGSSPEEADHALALALESAARAREAKTLSQRLEAELRGLDARRTELDAALGATIDAIATARQQVSGLATQIDEKLRVVEESRAEYSSVGERIEHLNVGVEFLTNLDSDRKELSAASAHVTDLAATWASAIGSSPFIDEADFTAAIAEADSADELAQDVEAFETALRVVEEGLEDPALSVVRDQETPPDPQPLITELALLEQAETNAAQTLGHQREVLESVNDRADEVRDELRAVASTADATEAVIRLADIVTANTPENLARVTLPTYVLVSRFKEVLSAANSRLNTMSDGRYSIVYLEDRESHGRRSGLGLSILDRHSEKERSPGDLSGGETFYTSLALALGLADVVVQEAGGVELGTLFIDEGFGTLDSHTLDSVLAEIAVLRRGGRAVGVVSHVDELKQRISERIEISKRANGTSTLKVIA